MSMPLAIELEKQLKQVESQRRHGTEVPLAKLKTDTDTDTHIKIRVQHCKQVTTNPESS